MSHAAHNDFQMPLWPDVAADPLLPIAEQFVDLHFGEGLCILELQGLRRVVFVDGVTWGQVDHKQTAPASREEALQQLGDFRDLGGSPAAWRKGTPALYGLFTLKTRSGWHRTLDACSALGMGTREAVDGGLTSALVRAISQAVERAHAHCPTPAHVDHHRLGTQAALRARAYLAAGPRGVENVAQLTKSSWPVLPLALLTSEKALLAVSRGASIYRAWLAEGYPKAQLRQWLRPSGSFPECLSRGVTDLEGLHRVLRLLGELPHQATFADGWMLDSTMNEFGTDRETVWRWAIRESSRSTKALHTLLGALSTVVKFADTNWPLERLLELRPNAVVSLAVQLHQNEKRCRKMMASSRASWLDEVMTAFSSWADQQVTLGRLGWRAPASLQQATAFGHRHGYCSHNAAVVEILVLNANMLLINPETGMQASINIPDARVVELRRPKNEHAEKTTRLALEAAVATLRSPATETLRTRVLGVIDCLRRLQWEDALRRVDGQRSVAQDDRHLSCQ